MAQKSPRIGVVGSSNVDLVTYVERMPVWGETIAAPRFEMNMGGKGANQAVAAAKLGASVVMVSKVGDDALGEGVLRNFEEIGVGTSHVQRVANQSTGTATILVNAKGDNFILIVKGANGDLTPADVEAAGEDLKACDLILTQFEVPLDTVYAALAFGKSARRQDHAQPRARRPEPRHGQGAARELSDPERDRARHSDRHAGRNGGRDRRRREEPRRARDRDGHRDPRRARLAARHRRGLSADRAGQGRGGRIRRGPATPSSAPSPAISPWGFRSRRLSNGRPFTPPIRSPNAGRRSRLRPRPSSRRSAVGWANEHVVWS